MDLKPEAKRSERRVVLLTPAQVERVERAAEALGVPISAYLRIAALTAAKSLLGEATPDEHLFATAADDESGVED